MESFATLIYIVKTFGLTLLKDIVSFVKFRQNENFNIHLSIQGLPSSHILRSQHLPEIVLGMLRCKIQDKFETGKAKFERKLEEETEGLTVYRPSKCKFADVLKCM